MAMPGVNWASERAGDVLPLPMQQVAPAGEKHAQGAYNIAGCR